MAVQVVLLAIASVVKLVAKFAPKLLTKANALYGKLSRTIGDIKSKYGNNIPIDQLRQKFIDAISKPEYWAEFDIDRDTSEKIAAEVKTSDIMQSEITGAGSHGGLHGGSTAAYTADVDEFLERAKMEQELYEGGADKDLLALIAHGRGMDRAELADAVSRAAESRRGADQGTERDAADATYKPLDSDLALIGQAEIDVVTGGDRLARTAVKFTVVAGIALAVAAVIVLAYFIIIDSATASTMPIFALMMLSGLAIWFCAKQYYKKNYEQ